MQPSPLTSVSLCYTPPPSFNTTPFLQNGLAMFRPGVVLESVGYLGQKTEKRNRRAQRERARRSWEEEQSRSFLNLGGNDLRCGPGNDKSCQDELDNGIAEPADFREIVIKGYPAGLHDNIPRGFTVMPEPPFLDWLALLRPGSGHLGSLPHVFAIAGVQYAIGGIVKEGFEMAAQKMQTGQINPDPKYGLVICITIYTAGNVWGIFNGRGLTRHHRDRPNF